MTQGLLRPAPYCRVPGASFSAAISDHVTCAVFNVVDNNLCSFSDLPSAQSCINLTSCSMLIMQQLHIAVNARVVHQAAIQVDQVPYGMNAQLQMNFLKEQETRIIMPGFELTSISLSCLKAYVDKLLTSYP